MKEQFSKKIGLNKANQALLLVINKIIIEYKMQGYILTLRQLYYQLVSKNIIKNDDKEYKKLSSLLVSGRMAGIVDWSAIEDRVRVPKVPFYVSDVPHALEVIKNQYRLDRMKNQAVY